MLVYSGEIYNSSDLRRRLIDRGHLISAEADGEVIVHAFEEYGCDFLGFLDGVFALALWNSRTQTLILARDRLGHELIAYSISDGTLTFASELGAILKCPHVDRSWNEDAVTLYFQLGYIPHPQSIFRAIRKLPPASFLRWEQGKVTIEQYWAPKVHHGERLTIAEYGLQLHDLVMRSVERRLHSGHPVGVFLSGGLDSSTVAYAVHQLSAQAVKTFTVGFRDARCNEAGFARLAADFLGAEHHELIVDCPRPDQVRRAILTFGEPFADPSIVPSALLSDFARETVDVVLTGDGCDELLAGYTRYSEALRSPHYLRTNVQIKLDGVPDLGRLLPDLHKPDLAANLLSERYERKRGLQRLDRLVLMDICTYLVDDVLFKLAVASVASSLVARTPFLDLAFVEWALGLPADARMQSGRGKWVLLQSMHDRLPAEIVLRAKQGFAPPLSEWLSGPLRDLVNDTVDSLKSVPMFSASFLEHILEDGSSRGYDRLKWRVFVFGVWYESTCLGGKV